MTNNDSILEKVIATQIKEEAALFNPKSIINEILSLLPTREKDVIALRHGLNTEAKRYTLEDIGKVYNITRERVRQIEVVSIKQLKKFLRDNTELNHSLVVVEQIIRDLGGVIEANELIRKVKELVNEKIDDNFVVFFLELAKDQFLPIRENKNFKAGWQLPDFNSQILSEVILATEEMIKRANRLFTTEELWQQFKKDEIGMKWQEKINLDIFFSYIKLSKKLKVNPFGDWGFYNWPLISPRRMNDKIYLVLKHGGQPMHFREIATKINEANFDGKKAHAATIHNELILDNSRYVLIGRGIYALKEWGYKPGVVAEVIKEIIQNSIEPLTKQEIIKEVLQKRLVKESTIALALMNKKRFTKNADGTYKLAAS